MSNEAELCISNDNAMEIAAVAESYTRRLVELEKDRRQWMQEAVNCGKARNEALDRAKKAEVALSAAQARIAELEEDTSEVQHPWRERLDEANKRIAELDAEVKVLGGDAVMKEPANG